MVTNYYDGWGRRIARIEDGTLELYVWDPMTVVAVADEDADLTEYYTRGMGIAGDVGTLVASHHFGDGSTVLLHNNHRGDVVLATDASGAVSGTAEFTPFGNVLSSSGHTSRFGFSSKELDASGLIYYGYRYYSPEMNAWVSFDPAGEYGGINLYRFCYNNPLCYVDNNGLWVIPVVMGFVAAVALGIGLWKMTDKVEEREVRQKLMEQKFKAVECGDTEEYWTSVDEYIAFMERVPSELVNDGSRLNASSYISVFGGRGGAWVNFKQDIQDIIDYLRKQFGGGGDDEL